MRYILQALTMLVLLSGLAVKADEQVRPLVVTLPASMAPYSTMEKGELYGFLVDFWQLWAEYADRDVSFLPADHSQMQPNLDSGHADLIGGVLKPAESSGLLFSRPFYSLYSKVYYRRDALHRGNLLEMNDPVVGLAEGSHLNDFVLEHLDNATLHRFQTLSSMIQALRQGTLDAFVGDDLLTKQQLSLLKEQDFERRDLFRQPLYAAASKEQADLIALFNRVYAEIPEQELKQLELRWFDEGTLHMRYQNSEAQLTTREQAWIKQNPVVRVAVDSNYAPIEFINERGEYSGIMADYLALIEQATGLRFQIVPSASWDDALNKVRTAQAEILPAIQQTGERERFLRFSEPFLEVPAVIITRQSRSDIQSEKDLDQRTVAVVAGDIAEQYLAEQVKGFTPVYVGSHTEALQLVSLNRADAVLMNLAIASAAISSSNITNLQVAARTKGQFDFRIGIRRDLPLLRSILDKGLASVTKEQRDQIKSQWIHLQHDSWRPSAEQIAAVLALIAFLIASLVWNRRLHQEVNERIRIEADLQEAKEAAEAANLAKSQFLANMSHEIRTPMNGIIGLTHLLGHTSLSAKQRDYVEKIALSSDLLLEIINDILDFSRIEAGRLELDQHPFSLRDEIKQLVGLLEGRAVSKSLALRADIDPELPDSFLGDPLRLKQVLMNLGSNALKFTSDGEIVLRFALVKQEGGVALCRFEVEDTGIGIDNVFLPQLFDAFAQEDSSTSRRFGGSGLGLAICRRLVNLMGGEISVRSEKGKGTCFTFELPLQQIEATQLESKQQTLELQPELLKGRRLLLVEDNLINQQVVAELLRGFGASVRIAGNGLLAIQALRDESFDLVLMDMQMPQMDGLETTRRLRRMSGLEELPVIAMTASVMSADRQACMDAGMNDHLGKPVVPADLIRVLQQWLPDMKEGASPVVKELVERTAVSGVDIGARPHLPVLNRAHLEQLPGIGPVVASKLLSQFALSYQGIGEQVELLREAGEKNALKALLHGLKGAAGNIGAEQLADLARLGESQLIQGEALTDQWLDELTQAWGLFSREVSFDQADDVQFQGSGPVDEVEVEDLLAQIEEKLAMGDSEVLEDLQPLLRLGGGERQRLARLMELIESLDFDAAEAEMRQLRSGSLD